MSETQPIKRFVYGLVAFIALITVSLWGPVVEKLHNFRE
jgi:hypothetical protein